MLYIDAIPIMLAIIAIFSSAKKYEIAENLWDKSRLLICIFVSIVMIITQTSLLISYDVLFYDQDNTFASNLYILFDVIVMILIIFYPVNTNDKH